MTQHDDTTRLRHMLDHAVEMIENALQLMRDRESLSADDIEDFRREITVGMDQADRGEFVDFDAEQIKTEGRARLYPGRSS